MLVLSRQRSLGIEAPAGHRADQADLGPRLGAVTGRRPARNVIALFREAGEQSETTVSPSETNPKKKARITRAFSCSAG